MFLIGEVGLQSNQQTQSSLIDILSNYHGNDGNEPVTPIRVIKEIYSSDEPFLLTMLHLSFSELFQNMKIWASLNDQNQVLVKPRSDALMLETAKALEQADSDGDGSQLRTSLNNKISMLNSVFLSEEFSHLQAPKIIQVDDPLEDLLKLIDNDKIIPSFRTETLHNILTEGCAMLELSEVNPFDTFTSDKLIWTKGYWKFLTKAYGPKRTFLSQNKQIMNTLRFSLFSLIESRLHRVESRNYQEVLDTKIQSYLLEFTKLLTSQKSILTVQKAILNTIAQEDSPSGFNPPIECPPCEILQTQHTPPEFNIIIRKLQSLTDKISRLGSLYRTLNTNTISNDLAKIENDLNSFTNNFNNTLNFFSQINSQLDNLNNLYEEYQLFYIVYAILASVLILVIIKLFTLACYILSLCKEYGQIIRDFQAFRHERHNQDRQRHQEERAYPLVAYNSGRT